MPHYKPTKRYELAFDRVSCWQDDGVWMAKLSPVEMQLLGVNRFGDSERDLDQASEDSFCARLRMHGAHFWTLPPKWPYMFLWCESVECVEPTRRAASFDVGFPASGGVWVLNATDRRDHPERTALRNALTMEERCDALSELGAVFCDDERACPLLESLMAA